MNMKKNNNLVIVLLLYSPLFQTCFANHLETVEEILRFCSDNGHLYIAILDQDFKAHLSFMKSSMNEVRIKSFVRKENLTKRSETNIDTLVLQKNISSLQFDNILEMMSTRKIQKSILVVRESEVQDFNVSIYNINCLFFITFLSHILFSIHKHLEIC